MSITVVHMPGSCSERLPPEAVRSPCFFVLAIQNLDDRLRCDSEDTFPSATFSPILLSSYHRRQHVSPKHHLFNYYQANNAHQGAPSR